MNDLLKCESITANRDKTPNIVIGMLTKLSQEVYKGITKLSEDSLVLRGRGKGVDFRLLDEV